MYVGRQVDERGTYLIAPASVYLAVQAWDAWRASHQRRQKAKQMADLFDLPALKGRTRDVALAEERRTEAVGAIIDETQRALAGCSSKDIAEWISTCIKAVRAPDAATWWVQASGPGEILRLLTSDDLAHLRSIECRAKRAVGGLDSAMEAPAAHNEGAACIRGYCGGFFRVRTADDDAAFEDFQWKVFQELCPTVSGGPNAMEAFQDLCRDDKFARYTDQKYLIVAQPPVNCVAFSPEDGRRLYVCAEDEVVSAVFSHDVVTDPDSFKSTFLQMQRETPQQIGHTCADGTKYWWYGDHLFRASEKLSAAEFDSLAIVAS